jgi:hypothetical protein
LLSDPGRGRPCGRLSRLLDQVGEQSRRQQAAQHPEQGHYGQTCGKYRIGIYIVVIAHFCLLTPAGPLPCTYPLSVGIEHYQGQSPSIYSK